MGSQSSLQKIRIHSFIHNNSSYLLMNLLQSHHKEFGANFENTVVAGAIVPNLLKSLLDDADSSVSPTVIQVLHPALSTEESCLQKLTLNPSLLKVPLLLDGERS